MNHSTKAALPKSVRMRTGHRLGGAARRHQTDLANIEPEHQHDDDDRTGRNQYRCLTPQFSRSVV